MMHGLTNLKNSNDLLRSPFRALQHNCYSSNRRMLTISLKSQYEPVRTETCSSWCVVIL